jgi:hypothetical protein
LVTAPADITLEATGALTPVTLGTATATSPVDGSITPSTSDTGPFAVGSHLVTWTATDSAGNVGKDIQSVIITDITAPTVTAPADITLEAKGALTPVTLGTASATDLVDGSITPTASPTGPFAVGVHTVTWSATDGKGNVGTRVSHPDSVLSEEHAGGRESDRRIKDVIGIFRPTDRPAVGNEDDACTRREVITEAAFPTSKVASHLRAWHAVAEDAPIGRLGR